MIKATLGSPLLLLIESIFFERIILKGLSCSWFRWRWWWFSFITIGHQHQRDICINCVIFNYRFTIWSFL